jgi:hypothetical protein
MNKIYECHNQLTGQLEQAETFEKALSLRQKLQKEYVLATRSRRDIESLFQITVLIQNEDGAWVQSLADNKGNPIIENS